MIWKSANPYKSTHCKNSIIKERIIKYENSNLCG